jgi:hypothetical protein
MTISELDLRNLLEKVQIETNVMNGYRLLNQSEAKIE